jgi:hypothetical protein
MKKKKPQTASKNSKNPNANPAIAYQNKDIVSKLFGEQMKGKSLSLFGLDTNLKVMDIRPTNIPIVQAKELRMDNLFELEDGSVAILDYESQFKETNFTKYGYYIMNVINRYLNEGKTPDIHMMVLYTADIETAKTTLERTACRIKIEAAYLTGTPSEQWLIEIKESLANQIISDKTLMRLILLPLTYKDEEKKQETIKLCVNLAQKIPDKEQETFALAGILAFTDKIISNSTKKYIEEVLGMTQVGQMLMDKGRKEGTITLLFDLYNDGDITLHKAASKSGMSEEDFLKAAKSILEK